MGAADGVANREIRFFETVSVGGGDIAPPLSVFREYAGVKKCMLPEACYLPRLWLGQLGGYRT